MKELTLSTLKDSDSYVLVLEQLDHISRFYGFKIPDGKTGLGLAEYVIRNFGSLVSDEIKHAFELAATGKLKTNITSYGKILTLPVLFGVLTEYRNSRNLRRGTKPQSPKYSEDELLKLNCDATIVYLHQLKTKKIFNFKHYEIIDSYIEKFKDEDRLRVYRAEYQKELESVKDKRISGSFSRIQINSYMTSIEKVAGSNAQSILVKEFLEKEIKNIDFAEVEKSIKDDYFLTEKKQY
jgi:hypothetical protein